MDQVQRQMAAAAYDRCLDDPASRRGTSFVIVDLEADWQRIVLCAVTPTEAPPPALQRALSASIELLRGVWIAMLREADPVVQAQLDEIHEALQHEVIMAERAWEIRLAGSCEIAASLAEECAHRRAHIARLPPSGQGIVVPGRSRASEPYPLPLRAACNALRGLLAAFDEEHARSRDRAAARESTARRVKLEEACYAAVGSFRLGESDAARVAAQISACIEASLARSRGQRVALRGTLQARANGA